MSLTDITCIIPFLLIATAPVILMITLVVRRNFSVASGFSLVMFTASLLSLIIVAPHTPHEIAGIIMIDNYALMFLGIILFTGILLTVFSTEYLAMHRGEREEYFIILFVAVLGASVLVTASHFVTFFVGLETMSISIFIMIAYLRFRDNCIEAGVKYLVTASVSTAFILFGMGLIYTETGTMNFSEIAGSGGHFTPVFLAGMGLIIAGIGFKLALVPFHMWIPDIYHGAPVPVSAFIATISKGAVLALALRLFAATGGAQNTSLILMLTIISVISMFTGNFLALSQQNTKKLLAFSSVAHLGYLMITLIAGNNEGIHAAVFYIVAYIISTLGAFSVISVISSCDKDADNIDDLKGLFWTNPFLALLLSLSFLSLAGLPLTAGFMSKFYLVLAGIRSDLWVLAISLIINSAISLFYYLRVVKTMLTKTDWQVPVKRSFLVNISLFVIAAGILILGVFPAALMDFINMFSGLNR
jgi:NADH-quinone oxidoreductase subunit N